MTAAIKVGLAVSLIFGLLMVLWIIWQIGRAATRGASPADKSQPRGTAVILVMVAMCVFAGEALGVTAQLGSDDESSALAGVGIGSGIGMAVMIVGLTFVSRRARRRNGDG